MKTACQRIIFYALFLTLSSCNGVLRDSDKKAIHPTSATRYEFVLGTERFSPESGVIRQLPERVSKLSKQRASLSAKKYNNAHIIVQSNQPLTLQNVKVLKSKGIKILNKINNYTWVASTEVSGASELLKLEMVRWADIYPTTAKLSQDINDKGSKGSFRDREAEHSQIDPTSDYPRGLFGSNSDCSQRD